MRCCLVVSFHYFCSGVAPESGVTVVLPVFLVSNFKMKEGNFFIRAHGDDLGDFKKNCVHMKVVE